MLYLLSMLVLLMWLPGNEGAEVKTLSQRTLPNACTLVMCSPAENGQPGRDGRDGREGPRGEKGDPGRVGISLPGRVGLSGMPGPAGPVGPKGDNGSAGEPGPKGDSGPSGEPWVMVFICPPSLPLSAAIFPDGRSIGDKIFRTSVSEKSFADAQEVCRQAGGQLASPRSAAENAAIQQLITAHNKPAFLSMTDERTEGKFTYPTGEALVYSNWAPGEPNNKGGAENCVEIYTNGQWNDQSCGDELLVVCEF
ncbi:Pulmonary surfactant-associated protein D [Lemmus lemmus]